VVQKAYDRDQKVYITSTDLAYSQSLDTDNPNITGKLESHRPETFSVSAVDRCLTDFVSHVHELLQQNYISPQTLESDSGAPLPQINRKSQTSDNAHGNEQNANGNDTGLLFSAE